jgi:hypothetical protein
MNVDGVIALVPIVKSLYEAVGHGDVEAVGVHLAEDVAWEVSTESATLPWAPFRSGRDSVAESFQPISGLEVRMLPRTFLQSDDTVAVVIGFETVLPPAAGASESILYRWDEVHQWRFNGAGLVSLFRQRHDRRPQGLVSAGRGRVIPFSPDGDDDR